MPARRRATSFVAIVVRGSIGWRLASVPAFLALAVFVAWTLATQSASADPATEKQALALQKKAIEEDSLNVAYPDAIKKLATAISKCGSDKCKAPLKGALYRDLGAMLILNGSVDDGRAAFAKALGFDPTLELDPAYKSPMLEGLWSDSKKKAGGAAGPSESGGAAGAGAGAGSTAGAGEAPGEGGASVPPTGDFAHVPAGSQLVRTPLPVYAEYVGSEKLLRVVVKYRGAGMTDWKPVELRKMETGYGGLIPCKDVAEGSMQYYIQGYGTSDDPVASSGTRSKPYSVPIKSEISGQGPSLPGQEPPRQCSQTVGGSDCPPDFPGCKVQKKSAGDDCHRNGECESGQCASGKCIEKKGEGDDCDQDSECASGTCADNKCTAPKKSGGDSCDTDDDCTSGSCKDGKCKEGDSGHKGRAGKVKKIWIGFAASWDVMSLPAADNVCALTTDGLAPLTPGNPYQCVEPGTNANFPGSRGTVPDPRQTNGQIVTTGSSSDRGDYIGGGLSPGNLRLLASFDYALGMNFLLGVRAGYVLFTDPAQNPGPSFIPFHIEARGAYVIGKDALANTVAPMLVLAAGAGEFDANLGVTVKLNPPPQPPPPPAFPKGLRNENAWVTAGPLFVAGGVGARFLFSPSVAATVVVKGEAAFGGSAGSLVGLAPEAGMQFGF